jgi:hypothetical protein
MIEIYINVFTTAAGTITIQFAQNASNAAASTVLGGSTMGLVQN